MKIVIGLSGSSGAIYARLLLEKLNRFDGLELAVVVSANAKVNISIEMPDFELTQYRCRVFENHDFNAPFASGSAGWDALVVCPCSAGFLAKVATGLSEDLMSRTAQVMLKERKKLLFVFRETPLNLIHIENMKTVTLAGGIICPAVPSFYAGEKEADRIFSSVTDRVIDLLGLDSDSFRWGSGSL
ncbi:MAG: UbiX family flavin prenyltransferase [Saprospiraceae bacterium]|nr:UbiX family flavin prenyltransferase [Saprospiraceae bacterium]HMW37846.1 UbiX family flavin prenyltransferase [Saprospiraceae bacterium]HMX87532.1 UbiX family flavin prenyltransferase [Saprospiraceae bacterium]HMZ39590.1 UbiX family flavin prenyltransferase [Saprospiraceae bacterium]HNA63958.1 UbiX family flavin prenyltransferase [Saprospiraceae bacterium]